MYIKMKQYLQLCVERVINGVDLENIVRKSLLLLLLSDVQ